MSHIKSGEKVRKAVFPVAGMGSRFLPATKANPKEMMPVVDKPLIQYAVEEAVEAGITEMIFVRELLGAPRRNNIRALKHARDFVFLLFLSTPSAHMLSTLVN